MTTLHNAESSSEPSTDDAAVPLTLYAHFPWCVRKCPYCDFNSHPLGGGFDEAGYVNALVSDLDFELSSMHQARSLGSIFLGGGTPSLFSPAAIGSFLEQVECRLPFLKNIEITMEANPGTVEHADFDAYRLAGVNRISLGVQSFDAQSLVKLGRIHGPKEAVSAFELINSAGLKSINVDLMHGLPGQTPAKALEDIEQAIALGPNHISAYQLTLEPNTVFYRYPPEIPAEETLHAIQDIVQQTLESAGYMQYEVSAFARDGLVCRHNLNYWRFGDYIGIGAGAHGKLTDVMGRITRRAKKKHPATFIATAGTPASVNEIRCLTREDILLEYLMNALRLREGFTFAQATACTGISESAFCQELAPSLDEGLLENTGLGLRCTPRGYLFIDTILAALTDIGSMETTSAGLLAQQTAN